MDGPTIAPKVPVWALSGVEQTTRTCPYKSRHPRQRQPGLTDGTRMKLIKRK
jgi:hypothetical protein